MIKRRATREVAVGNVLVGGEAPVSIQSMTNTFTADYKSTIDQINEIYRAGGELVRVAVPDEEALNALDVIVASSPIPVIADIHFKHELALKALDKNVAKLRINPGNFGGTERLLQVADKAGQKGVPLRIGVNAGSLERKIYKFRGEASPEALVESALKYIRVLEGVGFLDIIVSVKAADAAATFQAFQLLAQEVNYPFHIGVTEAGPLYRGMVKSAVGIGSLLMNGVGDTIRVSLTADPVEEIKAARLILQAAGIRYFGPDLVSCPTCGRCEIDVAGLAGEVEEIMEKMEKPFKIAVMGCVVNGPGEGREADLGVTGTSREGIIFKHGEIIRRVPRESLLKAFKEELTKLSGNSGGENN